MHSRLEKMQTKTTKDAASSDFGVITCTAHVSRQAAALTLILNPDSINFRPMHFRTHRIHIYDTSGAFQAMETINGAFLDLVPPNHQQKPQLHRPKLYNITFDSDFFANGISCCHICTDSFQLAEEVASHEICKQLWHVDCLKLWIQHNDTCTECRAIIRDRKAQRQNVCKYNDEVYHDLIMASNRVEAGIRSQTIQHRHQVKYLSGLEQFLEKRIRSGTKFDFVKFGPHPGENPDTFDDLIGILGVLAEYVSGCRCCKRRLVDVLHKKQGELFRSWHQYSAEARRKEVMSATATEVSWSETSSHTASS